MVVGAVGSGKSSLMSAILGEMTTLGGSVQFNRYISQKPDIMIYFMSKTKNETKQTKNKTWNFQQGTVSFNDKKCLLKYNILVPIIAFKVLNTT